jgi:hypothetical protein
VDAAKKAWWNHASALAVVVCHVFILCAHPLSETACATA